MLVGLRIPELEPLLATVMRSNSVTRYSVIPCCRSRVLVPRRRHQRLISASQGRKLMELRGADWEALSRRSRRCSSSRGLSDHSRASRVPWVGLHLLVVWSTGTNSSCTCSRTCDATQGWFERSCHCLRALRGIRSPGTVRLQQESRPGGLRSCPYQNSRAWRRTRAP